MNTNLFRARLDAAFLVPFLTRGGNYLYRADEPVNLDDLLLDVVDSDEEWRRVGRLGMSYLYNQVSTADVTLALFEWDGPVVPARGTLYLANFGLPKAFIVTRSRLGPHRVVAAYRHLGAFDMVPLCVESMLAHGAEWYPEELFDELPARTYNRRPDLLPRQLLLDGYRAFVERVLGEPEPALVEAYFESTYAEEQLPVPAPAPAS
jgi:hypothetical protein